MLCGVGIPAGRVSYPIFQQHLCLQDRDAVGMVGMEKVLLLVVGLCTALLEWHILVQGSVSACITCDYKQDVC